MKNKSFDKDLYKKTGINNLILFCIYSVAKKKEKCTFERLVQECFSLFPEVLRFPHQNQWPDSRKLDRPLRALRKRKLIAGHPQTAFSLAKPGKKIAQEIGKTFGQRKLEI